MSQQNATLLPKKKVLFVCQEENPNKTCQGFTTAKKLWQKEVWWKAHEEADPQHDLNKKEGHHVDVHK